MPLTRKIRDLLGVEDRDRLIAVLAAGAEVRKPSQFFAWTQGPLQALLPHEILICAAGGHDPAGTRLRYFTATRYFRANHFEAACHPRGGFITEAIRHWRAARRPCLCFDGGPPSACAPHWLEKLSRLELRNMAAHGVAAPDGGVQSWFGLFRLPRPDGRYAPLLELLLPTLAASYARVLAEEATTTSAAAAAPTPLLTVREREVLTLVRDGLSNPAIGECLGVSAATAKNHVQNLRAKLKARNRAQAVSEGLRLGLIEPVSGDAP